MKGCKYLQLNLHLLYLCNRLIYTLSQYIKVDKAILKSHMQFSKPRIATVFCSINIKFNIICHIMCYSYWLVEFNNDPGHCLIVCFFSYQDHISENMKMNNESETMCYTMYTSPLEIHIHNSIHTSALLIHTMMTAGLYCYTLIYNMYHTSARCDVSKLAIKCN